MAYIIALDTKGIRWTHPDPDLIGKPVVGSYAKALAGHVHRNTCDTPSAGRAADSVVPVFDTDGKVVGLVSVGITLSSVNEQVMDQLPLLIGSAGGGLAFVAGGTALVSRRLRRQTHGLGPAEMTRMYEHHDAVLHSVREGVVVVSGEGRLLLANDEARRLLDLPEEGEGRRVAYLGLAPRAAALPTSDRVVTDEVILAGERLLAVNLRPTAPTGSVATPRDTTELRALAGRAEPTDSSRTETGTSTPASNSSGTPRHTPTDPRNRTVRRYSTHCCPTAPVTTSPSWWPAANGSTRAGAPTGTYRPLHRSRKGHLERTAHGGRRGRARSHGRPALGAVGRVGDVT
ncbi:hypothetical protein SUDANB176_00030 [Streptomyces sp. enrichment culture]